MDKEYIRMQDLLSHCARLPPSSVCKYALKRSYSGDKTLIRRERRPEAGFSAAFASFCDVRIVDPFLFMPAFSTILVASWSRFGY